MNFRVTIYLPSGLPFIITCGVLRFIEGMGTSLYNTSTIVLFAHLYPEKLGAIFVSSNDHSNLARTHTCRHTVICKYTHHPLIMYTHTHTHTHTHTMFQGVKQTSSGLGYATGPVIGGFLYLVNT